MNLICMQSLAAATPTGNNGYVVGVEDAREGEPMGARAREDDIQEQDDEPRT